MLCLFAKNIIWGLQKGQSLQGMGSRGRDVPFLVGMKIFEFLTFLDAFSEHFLKVFWSFIR